MVGGWWLDGVWRVAVRPREVLVSFLLDFGLSFGNGVFWVLFCFVSLDR